MSENKENHIEENLENVVDNPNLEATETSNNLEAELAEQKDKFIRLYSNLKIIKDAPQKKN